ncbi:phosphotransferase enzyme family domain-containing protein [Hirsutella rhossiliensis]|uniref:Phosphotransferase enzyme family domain-containing protein n=1 Tax=Hirsutella rhossiliensis TaxID=111463 RepID=A0A9P8SI88_9HYPO|nr:phosphotransferase enzyme family domain-containing protein [Hirsutella rhossiliensis]KAH0962360.1 phosphotransferase enzyme family domain-containing protein [Hirsutella rhossiliensis]
MGQVLEASREDPNETPVLEPNISESKLKRLYVEMARNGLYHVMERPLTLNMSNMVQLSNIPKSIFPPKGTTYQTAGEWYTILAEMQIATLLFQHNDIVSSEDDCRTKYVARQLFRRLAKQGRLSSFGFAEDKCSGSFRLWSDDFRPANILVDENDRILGAIDWEYAYVGPTQFVLDPPWWLLLDVPEMWDDGIDNWTSVYERRLQTWLSAIEEAEQDINPGSLMLAAYMRESWVTGRFWLNYAARKSWAFDTVYWKYLDERFFAKRDYMEDRMDCIDDEDVPAR